MKKQLKNLILLICAVVAILYSCQKVAYSLPNTQDDSSVREAIINSKEQFNKTGSLLEKTHLFGLIANLNYTISSKIKLGDSATLFVVKLNYSLSKSQYFYTVIKTGDTYKFDGIYQASNIRSIESLFTVNKLPKGDSIYVTGIDQKPIKEWISLSDGKIHFRVNKATSHGSKKTMQAVTSSSHIKVNLADGGGSGTTPVLDCVEWWMCEYDPETGEWIPLYYLYSVCTDTSGGSGSGSSSNNGTPTGQATTPVVGPGPDKITDINSYMNCFTTNGSNAKVSVFINQPNPGTSDVFSLSHMDVGHSYLAFTQTLPNGTVVTRNVGYYPSSFVTPWNTSSSGELNNDQNSPFNVGLQISISSTDLMTMVNSVKNNSSLIYNLDAGNCVDWAMAILLSGGIDLISNTPISTGNILGTNVFTGFCPGQWGQTIADMTLGSNMSRLSTNSNHSNTGSCQ